MFCTNCRECCHFYYPDAEITRNNSSQIFFKTDVPKKLQYSQENTYLGVFFLMKLQAL